MDFGDILAQWEKQGSDKVIYDKDAAALESAEVDLSKNMIVERRNRLLRKKPDAFIDLHGFSVDEAWVALQTFFEDSRWRKLEKVMIIHGKGNHWSYQPSGEGVLRDITKRFIESCSYAGESGYTPARNGGRGATWVILKP